MLPLVLYRKWLLGHRSRWSRPMLLRFQQQELAALRLHAYQRSFPLADGSLFRSCRIPPHPGYACLWQDSPSALSYFLPDCSSQDNSLVVLWCFIIAPYFVCGLFLA